MRGRVRIELRNAAFLRCPSVHPDLVGPLGRSYRTTKGETLSLEVQTGGVEGALLG